VLNLICEPPSHQDSISPARSGIPESPGKTVVRFARDLFGTADQDHDGELDVSEVAWLVEQLWMKLGQPIQMAGGETELLRVVRAAVGAFDAGGESVARINFPEFLIMLTRKPWRELLPEHVPWAGSTSPSPSPSVSPSPVPRVRSPPRPRGGGSPSRQRKGVVVAQAILSEAESLFDAADRDQDGKVREAELRDMLTALWAGLDPDSEPIDMGVLNREVAVNMASHDPEDTGADFKAVLEMLSVSPWKERLPSAVRKEILECIDLKLNRKRSPSPTRSWLWQSAPDDGTPAEVVLRLAKRLWDEKGVAEGLNLDQKGGVKLEEESIARVMLTFWSHLGRPLPSDYRIGMVEQIRSVTLQHGGVDGRLPYSYFLRMITMKPWKDLMPPELQNSLPPLVLSHMAKLAAEELPPPKKGRPWDRNNDGTGGAQMVLGLVKELWVESSKDHEASQIEVGRIGSLLREVLNKIGGADEAIEGESQERHIDAGVDAIGVSWLSLNQFLPLLITEPWRQLFPAEIFPSFESAVNKALLEISRTLSPPRAKRMMSTLRGSPEEKCDELVGIAQRIFDSHDADKIGFIGEEEVGTALKALFDEIGISLPAKEKMAFMSLIHQSTGGKGLYFSEFLRLLTKQPWKQFLPPDVQASLPMIVIQLAKDSQPWSWPQDAPAAAFLSLLKEMYNNIASRVPNGGFINAKECTELIQSLFIKIGARKGIQTIQEEAPVSLEVLVLREIKVWGRGDNTVELPGVLRLLNERPWSALLPPEVAKELAKLSNREFRRASPVKRQKAARAPVMWIWEQTGEDGPQVLVQVAKELFLAADHSHSGQVEGSECAGLLTDLFTKLGMLEFPPDVKYNMQYTCECMVKRFDTEATGAINFLEFLRMVAQKPFRNLLPIGVANRLPTLICKIVKLALPDVPMDDDEVVEKEAGATAVEELVAGSTAEGKAVLGMAKGLFEQADKDNSGLIDLDELTAVLTELSNKLGAKPTGRDAMRREVKACMMEFDTDRSGQIDFTEYLGMVMRKPWRSLLPPTGVKQVEAMIERLKRKARNSSVTPWVWESAVSDGKGGPSDVLLKVTKDLFEEGRASSDGLGEEEVAWFFRTFFMMLGPSKAKLQGDILVALLPLVRKGMAQFPDADGMLSYEQVLRLFLQVPWRNNLPSEIRLQFSRLLVTEIENLSGVSMSATPKRESAFRWRAIAATPGDAVVCMCERLFAGRDSKKSGKLDMEAVSWLLKDLFMEMEARISPEVMIRLVESIRETMVQLQLGPGGGQNGFDLEGILQLLVSPTWKVMLPKQVQESLPMIVLGIHAKLHPQPGDALEVVLSKLFKQLNPAQGGMNEGHPTEMSRYALKRVMAIVWERTGRGPRNEEARVEAVEAVLRLYDVDNSGGLTLQEFSSFVCEKPQWCLLPLSIVDTLREARGSPQKGRTQAQQPAIWEIDTSEPPAKVVLRLGEELYAAALESSGEVDRGLGLGAESLCDLLKDFWSKAGRGVRSGEKLAVKESIDNVIARFGKQDSGRLLFHEFMMTLTMPPWRKKFTTEIRNNLPILIMKLSQAHPRGNGDDASMSGMGGEEQGAAMIAAAQALFEAADLNNTGEIDEEELAVLMQKMWQKLGRPMGNVRARLVEEVREHMKAFDKDRSGGLSFHEFLRMLTRKPWRDLLPPQVQKHLPLLVQGVISPQKKVTETTGLPALVVLQSARDIFQEYDYEKKGEMSESELQKMCEQVWIKLGRTVNTALRDEVRDLMLVFDKDGSGGIDFVEFVRLVARRPWKVLLRPDAQEALKHITLKELQDEARKGAGGAPAGGAGHRS